MKFISYNLDSKINPSYLLKNKLTITEQEILELQDLFLSNGMHCLAVPTLKEGRSLMYTFLNALHCYNAVSCITKIGGLRKNTFDVYSYLQQCGYLEEKNLIHLEKFLTEEFDVDFLWIECKKSDTWQLIFEQKIQEIGIDQHIPVMVLMAAE
jgi:hypothetical protein